MLGARLGRLAQEGVEEISEANLDDQMRRVAAVLDPVFSRG